MDDVGAAPAHIGALGDLIERAYMREGGTNVIHFIGTTSMHDPQLGVPAQFVSTRRVAKGDLVFSGSSATRLEHSWQVLTRMIPKPRAELRGYKVAPHR